MTTTSELPKDHPEYYGVKVVDSMKTFSSRNAPVDTRPDWAKQWRATMTFEDLRDQVEGLSVDVFERMQEIESELTFDGQALHDAVDRIKADGEHVADEVFNIHETLSEAKKMIAEHDGELDNLDDKISKLVQLATQPFIAKIDDLETQLREAFDLIEALEDEVDG